MKYVERNKMEAHQHMFSKNSTFDLLASKVTAATAFSKMRKSKPSTSEINILQSIQKPPTQGHINQLVRTAYGEFTGGAKSIDAKNTTFFNERASTKVTNFMTSSHSSGNMTRHDQFNLKVAGHENPRSLIEEVYGSIKPASPNPVLRRMGMTSHSKTRLIK